MKKIQLSNDKITEIDIESLISWLKTNPQLTKGKVTEEFERIFAEYIGVKYSVFVNSGSSALLLMLAALIQAKQLNVGDTIVVPNLSWSTDASSAYYAGLNVKFVDCNMKDLSLDLKELESVLACPENNIKAVLLVEVLGLVPDMHEIKRLCDKYEVLLLEDSCESLGSSVSPFGDKLGSFGFASVFSTYFGHHISTIEGGFVCTDDWEYYNILKSLRSHGWDRDLDPEFRAYLQKQYDVDEFKSRFAFYYPSFNLRSTDLQAFIGIGQMKKLPEIVSIRERNFNRFISTLNGYTWVPAPAYSSVISSFSYPIICKTKDEREKLVAALEANGVQTRPLIAGDMGNQPYIIDMYGYCCGLHTKEIDECGFYIPNHTDVTLEDVEFMCNIIKENL